MNPQTIESINKSAKEFLEVAEHAMLSKEVYEDGWDAKEIIAHIVFYHQYYASVVSAIVLKKELPLIDESLAKVNLESAKEYSRFSREQLLHKFRVAHKKLIDNILLLPTDAKIPYKKAGRIYEPEEYITEIARHIARHTKDLRH